MPFVSRMTSYSSFLGGLVDGSNNDKQRLESINTWLLSSYRGLGAGDNPADLEGKVSASLLLPPHLSSFPDFSGLASFLNPSNPVYCWARQWRWSYCSFAFENTSPTSGKLWPGDSKTDLKMVLTFVRDTGCREHIQILKYFCVGDVIKQLCHGGTGSAWYWEHHELSTSRQVEFTKWTVDGKLVGLKWVMLSLLVQSRATVVKCTMTCLDRCLSFI